MFRRLRSKTNEEPGPAPPLRQPNKLSKPRTNKHVATTSSKQVAKRNSRPQLPGPGAHDSEGQHGLPEGAGNKHELRRQTLSQIFGRLRDEPAVGDGSPDADDSHPDASTVDLSASVSSHRASRAHAVAIAKLNGHDNPSQASLATEDAAHSPISPVQARWAGMSNDSAERVGMYENTSYADLREASSVGDYADEQDNSKTAKMIRRRSFATPGLATRQPRIDELPPVQPKLVFEESEAETGDWSQEYSQESPAGGSLLPGSHLSETVSPWARAQTPNEMDYGRIGTLQLGALTITNGRASPETSSIATRQITTAGSMPDFRREDDYYTASEGDRTPGTATPTAATFNEALGATYGGHDDPEHPMPLPSAERAYRLPKRETHRLEPRSSSPLKQEILATKPSADSFTTCIMPSDEPRPGVDAPTVFRSASQFARGYMSELQGSPYEPQIARSVSMKRVMASRTISGQSAQSVSVYSVATDEGFSEPQVAEPLQKQATIDEAGSERLDDVDDESEEHHRGREMQRQQVSEDGSTQSTPPKTARPKQFKSDSGYSSATSVQDAPPLVADHDDSVSSGRLSSIDFDLNTPKNRLSKASDLISLYTFDQMLGKLPPVAAHYMEPSQPPAAPNPKPKRMSLLRSVSWGRSKSEAAFASTTSVPTVTSVRTDLSTSTTATGKSGRDRKKLQKFRPRARTAVTMPGLRPLNGDEVPRVPTPMRNQHRNRLSENPETSHIDKAFAVLDGDVDDDVSHLDSHFELRFPSPTPDPEEEEYDEMAIKKKRRSWRVSLISTKDQSTEDRPPTPPQHRSGVSGLIGRASRGVSRERTRRQTVHDEGAVIADFGIAAVSLGSSPYDIATGATRGGHRPSINTNATSMIHPHQISTSTSRPRSWVEMDDATAVEFAREKSKRRAAMASAWDEATGGMAPPPKSRPSERPRPRSFHEQVATPGSRTPSAGSMASLGRANSFNEGAAPPRRVASGGSEHERGRPLGFQEWELNRRNSRSRSRQRMPTTDGGAPPVPPLPAQTLEREEEHQYPDVPHKLQASTSSRPTADGERGSWRRPNESVYAPEVTDSAPTHQRQHQQRQTPDWSVSSDIWRQRRMLLSQNLHVQPSYGPTIEPSNRADGGVNSATVAPLPPPQIVLVRSTPTPTQGLQEIDGAERDRGEPVSHAVQQQEFSAAPPAPPAQARPSSARLPAVPQDARTAVDSARRRPTPFDRIATSPLSRPASSSSLSSRADAPRAAQAPTREVFNRAVYDRYSGGLGFEKGTGGSAGTRALQGSSGNAPRRSVQLSKTHGVDMSDVPVFLPARHAR